MPETATTGGMESPRGNNCRSMPLKWVQEAALKNWYITTGRETIKKSEKMTRKGVLIQTDHKRNQEPPSSLDRSAIPGFDPGTEPEPLS